MVSDQKVKDLNEAKKWAEKCMISVFKKAKRRLTGRSRSAKIIYRSTIQYTSGGKIADYGCGQTRAKKKDYIMCRKLAANPSTPCIHCLALYYWKCEDFFPTERKAKVSLQTVRCILNLEFLFGFLSCFSMYS